MPHPEGLRLKASMSGRPLAIFVISWCLLVTVKSASRREATNTPSLQTLYHKDFAVRLVSSKQFLGMPRGGETSRGTDQMATPLQSDRGQLQDRFSFISAVRALHKKSMLVKDEAEITSGRAGQDGTHGSNGAVKGAVDEFSSSSSPNSADDDQNEDDNNTGDLVVEDTIVEEKDTLAREAKDPSGRRYHQSSPLSPHKSRRAHRSVKEKNSNRDKSRPSESGSPRVDTCIIESSLEAGNDTLEEEVGLNGTKDHASFTDLDGNVPMFLEKTELPTENSEFIGMPLYNNTADESLYISSGYVSFSAL